MFKFTGLERALMAAITNQDFEILTLSLSYGGDPNLVSYRHNDIRNHVNIRSYPIHTAIKHSSYEGLRILLGAGAEASIKMEKKMGKKLFFVSVDR